MDSHLIPRAFYKLARAVGRANPNPVVVFKGQAKTTSKQVKDYFLCCTCEDRFNGGGEAFVLKWCSRGGTEFRLGEVVRQLPTVNVIQGFEIKGLGPSEEVLARKTGFFAASVFWRASARSWNYQGRTILPISLGPYQEEFRQYLLGHADFPKHAELFVQVSSDIPVGNWTFSPSKSRNSGITRHKFCVPGIMFTLFVGKDVPAETIGLGLAPGAKTVAYGPFTSDDWFVQRLREARKADKRGSLNKN